MLDNSEEDFSLIMERSQQGRNYFPMFSFWRHCSRQLGIRIIISYSLCMGSSALPLLGDTEKVEK
jgi:hypothetical protein